MEKTTTATIDATAKTDADEIFHNRILEALLISVNVLPILSFIGIFAYRITFSRRISNRRKIESPRIAPGGSAGSGSGSAATHSHNANGIVPIVPLSAHEDVHHENHADALLDHVNEHDNRLRRANSRRQTMSQNKTQLRLLARTKLKSSRKLSQVPAFTHLAPDAIGQIIDTMRYENHAPGTVICQEGGVADRFFVIIAGTCSVTSVALRHKGTVAMLGSLDVVGESMFHPTTSQRTRTATVTALGHRPKADGERSGLTSTLSLDRSDFERLLATGVLSRRVVTEMQSVGEKRRQQNRESFVAARAIGRMRRPQPPSSHVANDLPKPPPQGTAPSLAGLLLPRTNTETEK